MSPDRRPPGSAPRVLVTTFVAAISLAVAGLSVAFGVPQSTPALADAVVDGCTIVSSPTPTDFTNCPGTNLSDADLSGVDLSYANFTSSSFVQCLPGPPSSGTWICQNADLSDADLTGANLSSASLSFCEAVPPPSRVCATVDVSGSDLEAADLAGVQLAGVGLAGDNLSDADLAGSSFDTCGDGCSFADLAGTVLTGTSLVPSDKIGLTSDDAGTKITWSTPRSLPGAVPGACTTSSGSSFPLGSTTVTCDVADYGGDLATGSFDVDVTSTSFPPLQITSVATPSASIGTTYAYALAAQGGDGPYSWKLAPGDGRLPRGLHLDPATGVISGMPTRTSSTSTFTVDVSDAKLASIPHTRDLASAPFTIVMS